MIQVDLPNQVIMIEEEPDECPICFKSATLSHLGAVKVGDPNKAAQQVELIYQCPSLKCNRLFIARYVQREISKGRYEYLLTETLPNSFKTKSFEKQIENLSEEFVNIFNQASFAEQSNLDQIAGMAYRKALEFLIKDYCIQIHPDDRKNIEKMFLSQCIKNYVDHPSIKSAAEKSVWLGNDESHYKKKWKDRDISDLKILLNVTVSWINTDLLTRHYESEMSD